MTVVLLAAAGRAEARQLGSLVAPGPLTRAHAAVATNCAQCHEAARKVTASKCLACHAPIADRIARKSGVHRGVTTECVTCHSEHAGVDAEIRRINVQTFNHAAETGFVLEGQHAALATKCSACHKTRSFLQAKPNCNSCHVDSHKGNLGTNCASCHAPTVPFKQTRSHFDHSRAQFALTGSHRSVACEKCHVNAVFRGLKFEMCSSCHVEPHKGKFGPTCTTCHVTDQWATKTVEHGKTRFPLEGAHTQVACAKCHQTGFIKPIKSDTCASCHVNVHRESVKDDCRTCHTVASFKKAPFDHMARTGFALTGKHAVLECRKCHTAIAATSMAPLAQKIVDFSGASAQCVTCHVDKHVGQYGRLCDSCHRPTGFSVTGFVHPRAPEFYAGNHTGVACVRCHGGEGRLMPARAPTLALMQQRKTPQMVCATCHMDTHIGQLDQKCERCHAITAAKFAPVGFAHDTAAFTLTGKHSSLECAQCHTKSIRAYPSGTGAAVQFRFASTGCRTCHLDEHLGQVGAQCETCHVTSAFKIANYTHKKFADFFAGNHGKLTCGACHKRQTGSFPAGDGTAVRFRVGTTCASCHSRH